MRTVPILFLLLLCLLSPLAAGEAVFVYTEGEVDLKDKQGELQWVDIGDSINTGETVITGYDGVAEIEKDDSSVIKIASDTVFTYLEAGVDGRKRDVLSCALGSMTFKFGRTLGTEPFITTPSVVAGVRGTELTVFAGVDGTSLVVVESGQVDVFAEGASVSLTADEGVEVKPGEEPGPKFKVRYGSIDYSTWNGERERDFLADPAGSARGVLKRLKTFNDEIELLIPQLEKNKALIEREREKLKGIEEKDGKEAKSEYYKKNIFPLEVETSYMVINKRYFALSALSLRRFVLGRMYLMVKARYSTVQNDPEYLAFLDTYNEILQYHEQRIVPHLVEADI